MQKRKGSAIAPTWKQRFAVDHLGQNAAHGPYIDGLVVSTGIEHDLRRSVPSSSDLDLQETMNRLGKEQHGFVTYSVSTPM